MSLLSILSSIYLNGWLNVCNNPESTFYAIIHLSQRVDGDVFRMSEAADTAESVAARVPCKQTNKGRAAEELAKSTATLLPLLSDVLPMLRLLIKNR